MTIHWFPGHMHKARREIAKAMPNIDVVIEVLDARLPFSSENPLVAELRRDKPVVKILNKADLADPVRTAEWLAYFRAQEGVYALTLSAEKKGDIRRLPQACKNLAPQRVQAGRPVRSMIMGIPNVGKSTIINALLGKRVAKVGNEPAVTKAQQRFTISDGFALSDTPGILWPKIEDHDSNYRLAASGAIKDTVMEYEEVALYALDFLRRDYPQLLMTRYKFKAAPASSEAALEEIGRRRGCLRSGGIVDLHKAAETLVGDLRTGSLGLITLETVAEWEEKQRQAEELALQEEAARLAEQAAAEAEASAGSPEAVPASDPSAAS